MKDAFTGGLATSMRRWARGVALFALAVAFSSACASGSVGEEQRPSPTPGAQATPAAAVPPQFVDLYEELAARIAAATPSATSARPVPTVFAAELLPANGNAGAALLQPQTMATVRTYLDQLQSLGVRGVGLQISDPLLMPDFPRSAEYLRFFKQVVAEARGRGLTVLVETGPVFAGTVYSDVDPGGRWRDKDAYFRDRRTQLEIIARDVQPHYLSLGNEPDTERMLTGLSFSLDDYLGFLRGTVAALQPYRPVKLGAGTGTWDDPAYVGRFIRELPLDFIDLHVYPLSNGIQDYLERFVDLTRLARAHGREVVVGEAWLYKASAAEVRQRLSFVTTYGRDYYSFWGPLDAAFIRALGETAKREGVSFVSFFWSKYFFGYLDFEAVPMGLSPQDLIRLSNQAASQGMQRGEVTAAGEALRRLATGEGR